MQTSLFLKNEFRLGKRFSLLQAKLFSVFLKKDEWFHYFVAISFMPPWVYIQAVSLLKTNHRFYKLSFSLSGREVRRFENNIKSWISRGAIPIPIFPLSTNLLYPQWIFEGDYREIIIIVQQRRCYCCTRDALLFSAVASNTSKIRSILLWRLHFYAAMKTVVLPQQL